MELMFVFTHLGAVAIGFLYGAYKMKNDIQKEFERVFAEAKEKVEKERD